MSQCTRERDRSNLSISLSSCARKRYTHDDTLEKTRGVVLNDRKKTTSPTKAAHLRFQLRLWFFRRARRRAGRTARHRGPVRPCHASRRAASLPRTMMMTTKTILERCCSRRRKRRTRFGRRRLLGQRKGGGRHDDDGYTL